VASVTETNHLNSGAKGNKRIVPLTNVYSIRIRGAGDPRGQEEKQVVRLQAIRLLAVHGLQPTV
jgi:hypothetical protein